MNLDVIIILGGGIGESGEMLASTKERLDEFLRQKDKFCGTPVILSGRHGFAIDYKPLKTEARAMRDYLKKRCSSAKIYMEEKSLDTIGNAYFSKQIAARCGWRNILVITSDYHIKRTRWIFRKIFNDGYKLKFLSAPSVKFKEKQEKEKRVLVFTKKIWRRIGEQNPLEHHPFYSQTPEAQRIMAEINKL